MTNLHFTARNYAVDHTNKIHSDETARQFGFTGALVPGVGIYSYIIAPAVTHFGSQWLQQGTASVKFLKPVYDGVDVTVSSEVLNPASIKLALHDSNGVLCAVAEAGLEDSSLTISPDKFPLAPLPTPENRRIASADAVPASTVLGSLEGRFDGNKLGSAFDPEVRSAAVLLALANDIVAANVELGPWIHTGSVVSHFGTLEEDEPFSLRGSVTDSGNKRGHDFVVADLAVFGAAERPIAAIRHSALIRLGVQPSDKQ